MSDLPERLVRQSSVPDAEVLERLRAVSTASRKPMSEQPVPIALLETDRSDAPASSAQERLWVLNQIAPNSPFYNAPIAMRMKRVRVDALQWTLDEIVRRHEILRTTFHTKDGRPVQRVAPPEPRPIPTIDLGAMHEYEREAEVRRLVDAEAQRPFDLSRGPLFRTTLLRLDEQEHVLLITMHHIICDDRSIGILLAETSALYAAFCAGEASPLADPPLQYMDYAAWQRKWLESGAAREELNYWEEHLQGAPTLLELPTDRIRPPVQTYHGSRLLFRVPESQCQKLRELSRREGVTLFMTLLSAFQTLLHRYTHQGSISVGTPVAGRTLPETEVLIGCFLNLLVMRVDLADDPTFRALLKRVRSVALSGYQNQAVPFEAVVDAVETNRDASRHPLFQVLFDLHPTAPATPRLPNVEVSFLYGEREGAKVDLSLIMMDAAEGLEGWWEYSTDLFDASTVARMRDNFLTLLEGIASHPDARLSSLPIVAASELQLLVRTWNDTRSPYPDDRCIHELFQEQVPRSPNAVAVVFRDEKLTFGELNTRANSLAHFLHAKGVRPETRIGLYVGPSVEMIVGVLGILKAGGAYVPLDALLPPERLEFMIADTAAPIVLTHERLRSRLPSVSAEVISLDRQWDAIAGCPVEDPKAGAGPRNIAYVIYTSGSTGQPKGVLVEHRGLVNYLKWCVERYGMADGTGAPVPTALSFDLTVTALFGPLLAGKSITLLRHTEDVEALCDLLRDGPMFSVLKVTPSHLHLIGKLLPLERASFRVHTLVTGGEILSADAAKSWLTHAPETRLFNEYGPTETVVGSSVYEVPADYDGAATVPIGRPIPNIQKFVLDAKLQPVPIGVTGEIYIGGVGVTRGYLNRAALTAEKFIPDAFSGRPGERVYRTGDLGRYLPDGNLEFLGRTDDQIKIRGFRIDPGEIEAALNRHPAVRESVVVAREDAPGDKRLVAYLVPELEGLGYEDDLRRFVQQILPPYMIPSTFISIDSVPITPNGKLDRTALPAPRDSERLEERRAGPRTTVEQALTVIWTDLLSVEQVGIHDNFFALGGDSLLAIYVVHKATEAGIALTIEDVFSYQTIAELAAAVEPTPSGEGLVRLP